MYKKFLKLLRFYRRNRGKLKDFYLSVVAGLFSGTAMGIFFSLTTDINFNGWINLTNYEFFAALVYIVFTFSLLLILYMFGILLIKYMLKEKRRMFSFHLNFISGIYSTSLAFLLVLYYNEPRIRNIIAGAGIILFFVLAHFTIKRKWPK